MGDKSHNLTDEEIVTTRRKQVSHHGIVALNHPYADTIAFAKAILAVSTSAQDAQIAVLRAALEKIANSDPQLAVFIASEALAAARAK